MCNRGGRTEAEGGGPRSERRSAESCFAAGCVGKQAGLPRWVTALSGGLREAAGAERGPLSLALARWSPGPLSAGVRFPLTARGAAEGGSRPQAAGRSPSGPALEPGGLAGPLLRRIWLGSGSLEEASVFSSLYWGRWDWRQDCAVIKQTARAQLNVDISSINSLASHWPSFLMIPPVLSCRS